MKIGCTDVGTKTVGTILNGAYVKEVSQLTSPLLMTFRTTSVDQEVQLPTNSSGYDFEVDWGDGTIENLTGTFNYLTPVSHIYSTVGDYQIKIKGDFPAINTYNYGTECLDTFLRVDDFGSLTYQTINFRNSAILEQINGVPNCVFTDFNYMFYRCFNLTNIDLRGWNLDNVTSIQVAFYETFSVNTIDLSGHNLSMASAAGNAFEYSGAHTVILDNTTFHTIGVRMFRSMPNLTTFSAANSYVTTVIDAADMFTNCSNLTSVDLSTWDFSLCNRMGNMFSGCSSITTINLSNSTFPNVTDMSSAFLNCSSLENLIMDYVSFPSCTTFVNTFAGCTNPNLDLSICRDWVTSAATNLQTMFSVVKATVIDVSGWDTSNVTNMFYVFNACTNVVTLNVSGWNTANVTNMYGLFYFCQSVTVLDVSQWNVNKVTTMGRLFSYTYSVTNIDTSNWVSSDGNLTFIGQMYELSRMTGTIDLRGLNMTNVTNISNTFRSCRATSILVDTWKLNSCTNYINAFNGCLITSLDLSGWVPTSGSCQGLFQSCTNLTTLTLPNGFIGAGTTSLFWTFLYCKMSVLNTTNWDLSSVTSMSATFHSCINLTTIDLGTASAPLCNNFYQTFYNCQSLTTINCPNLVNAATTPNVSLNQFARSCVALTSINLSNWNTTNITNFVLAFQSTALTSLDLSHFSTTNVTSMNAMFSGVPLTYLNCQNWDWSNVTDLAAFASGMAVGCQFLVTNFNTASCTTFATFTRNLEPVYYDPLLIGNEAVNQNNGYTWSSTNSNYTIGSAAETARTAMINDHSVQILDGGGI